jgi:hypothetical protein
MLALLNRLLKMLYLILLMNGQKLLSITILTLRIIKLNIIQIYQNKLTIIKVVAIKILMTLAIVMEVLYKKSFAYNMRSIV